MTVPRCARDGAGAAGVPAGGQGGLVAGVRHLGRFPGLAFAHSSQ